MMDKFTNELNNNLMDVYIKEKKAAYAFYPVFSKMTDAEKVEYIQKISESELADKTIQAAYVNTLFFPNDFSLLEEGGSRLMNDMDNLKTTHHIGGDLLSEKRFEYVHFNFSQLVERGIFTIDEISQGPVFGDEIYQKYYNGNANSEKNHKK